MKRGGPLARTGSLARRTGLRRKPNPAWSKRSAEVLERAGYRCGARVPGVCTSRATAVHHRLLRSQGGGDDDENLMPACGPCHRWAHDNPAEAVELGLILRRGPRILP